MAQPKLIAGRYRLESKLASGGMGEVWVARDQTLGRRVAVKLLRDTLSEDPVVAERFRREALTAASFSHPNMADVYDYVEDNGRRGIVMELVAGETLAQRLRGGRLDVGEAVRIASEVLVALEAAHAAGIVHRDVKPGNIMLTPAGAVKVTDFGIARAQGDSTLTETGAVMGTAHYAAPEQVQGRETTPASDVYSLGCVLYECLTGRRPFEAETPVAAALARLTKDAPRPRRARPEIPAAIEAVVMRALARDPAARIASAAEMRAALTEAVAAADTDVIATQVLPAASGDVPTVVSRFRDAARPERDDPATRPRLRAEARPPRRPDRRTARTIALAVLVILLGAIALLMALAREPASVATPVLTGKPVGEAAQEAIRLGLQVRTQEATSAAPIGTVVRQDPPSGTPLERGSLVTLTVSKGRPGTPCCTVPSLLGMDRDEAEQALARAGLRLGDVTEQARDGVREGTVIGQSPAKGGIVAPGTTVDIVIAKEPDGRGKGKGEGKGD